MSASATQGGHNKDICATQQSSQNCHRQSLSCRYLANINKLHSIYPTVGILKHGKNMSCYDSVLLNRLRIGHFRLTHSYLLCGDAPPTCQSCGIPLTVKHILVECTNLRDIREKYFTVSSVTDLFKSIDNHAIINFSKKPIFITNCNIRYFNFILAL